MENDVTRFLHRLLPFMVLFQFFGFVSVFFIVMAAGGLDLTSYSEVSGFYGTLLLLPIAFLLTVFDLWLFPRLKYEEPAMLLFFAELMLNGALVYQAMKIWGELYGW